MTNHLEISGVMLDFYGHRVLEGIYLHSETGKVTGILGRNGTGKSCLMKIAYGSLPTNNKTIRINNKALLGSYRNQRDIRYLPQHNFIPKSLTLKRICTDFNLDFTGLLNYFPEFKSRYKSNLSQLSGGEQRIIEIYCILASETKFCMLDEPFSQIMPVHVQTIKSLILREKQNKGIIITDHLYKNVVDICDDTYLIKNGRTIRVNNAIDLVENGYIRKIVL